VRKNFQPQLSIDFVPVQDVYINLKSRDELPPVLAALQHIYVTPELRNKVFSILEEYISVGTDKLGRKGMDRWEVLVLAVVRLCLSTDYDRLHDLANNHYAIRGVLGILPRDYTLGKQYGYQTILDNVGLLNEKALNQINEIIVKEGRSILKKKKGPTAKNTS